MNYDASWMDPNSSWQAKANRAKEHIDALREHVNEFRASNPYSLTPEPVEKKPDWLAYRLRYPKHPPIAISTTIGDVLHNQRAALENLAYELALRSQNGPLTESQEKASTFPIRKTPDDFDRFIKDKGTLYDTTAYAALRSAQPFIILEQAHKHGVALDETFDEGFHWSILNRLNQLWNLDKHRRLTAAPAWWPDLIYWGSNGESKRRAHPGDGTLAHNSILLYIEGSDEGQGDEIMHNFNLVLTDDPAYSRDSKGATDDVVRLLENFQQHLWFIFSRVFSEMSG